MVPASPTAEIGDTRLESNVERPRVSGDDVEIQQNNKADSQDENVQVEQAKVDGDELRAATKEVIISQDKKTIALKMSK